jgi:hypothetical protein
VLVTARGTIDNGLPVPESIVVERVDATLDTRSALRTHGADGDTRTVRLPRRNGA